MLAEQIRLPHAEHGQKGRTHVHVALLRIQIGQSEVLDSGERVRGLRRHNEHIGESRPPLTQDTSFRNFTAQTLDRLADVTAMEWNSTTLPPELTLPALAEQTATGVGWPIQVLLIEDDPESAELVRDAP